MSLTKAVFVIKKVDKKIILNEANLRRMHEKSWLWRQDFQEASRSIEISLLLLKGEERQVYYMKYYLIASFYCFKKAMPAGERWHFV
jgi:hypothetical protein